MQGKPKCTFPVILDIPDSDDEDLGEFESYEFAFSNFSKEVKRDFSKTAPSYRVVTPGINFEGTFPKQDCIASNKKVWVMYGYQN